MSFSWWCKDKQGRNLFDEFGVNDQALGLGPNSEPGTPAPYRVTEIRSAWIEVAYKDKLQETAQDALRNVQAMARSNLYGLKPHHCETCTCPEIVPEGWSKEEIQKLLAIPLERVWRAGGGY